MSGHNQNSMQIADVQFYGLRSEPQVLVEVLDDAELDAVSGGALYQRSYDGHGYINPRPLSDDSTYNQNSMQIADVQLY